MTTILPLKEQLESIGGITPEIALLRAFGIRSTSDIGMFRNTTILDVGAGFSDLLDYISQQTTPARMIAVDPIYGEKEGEATVCTLGSIQKFIDLILSDPLHDRDTFLIQMRANALRQQQVTMDFDSQNTRIERYNEIPEDTNADFVFIINMLYAIKNPQAILKKVDEKLESDGKIIIIDYLSRGNSINKKLAGAGIAITSFDQYFIATLRKGDSDRINWNI